MAEVQVASSRQAFLAHGGETGALIAAHDWAATSLGPIELWPQSLKTATAILLRSAVPIVMLWDEDGVMLYNDAYSVFAGRRHPQLLGSKVREGWPEVADFNDNVMKVGLSGGTLAYKDQELTLHRNGRPEQVWMNLDYSPVLDESGEPAGVIAIVIETTSRVMAERRNIADRDRLTQMFEQAPGFMAMLEGPEHRFQLTNPAYRQLIGHREVIGKAVAEALPEAVEQGFTELLDEVYRSKKAFRSHGLLFALEATPGGPKTERLLNFVYQPVLGHDGAITGIFVEGLDVSEERRAQEALRKSEEFSRRVLASSDDCIKVLDLEGRLEMISEGGRRALGIDDLDPMLGTVWADLFEPAGRKLARAAVADAASGRRSNFEAEMTTRRGELTVWDTVLTPITDAAGHPEKLLALSRDVTRRKRADEALRQSGEQLRLATDAAEVGLWDVDIRTDTLFWPPRVKAMFGISADVPVTMADFYAGLHPDDLEHTGAAFAAAADPDRCALYDVEYRTLGKEDGVLRWVAAKGRGVFEGGRCLRVIGTAIDITARKAIAERLRESEASLREMNATLEQQVAMRTSERNLLATIVETTDVFIQVADLDYRFLAINTASAREFERLFGIRPKVGDSMLDLLADRPEHAAAVKAVWARALAGEEFTIVEPFGDELRPYYEIKFSTLRNEHGERVGAYQFVTDVTQRLRDQARLAETQAALRQSQKLEAMGQLTGGVAHDFNNLLTPIIGSLDMLQRRGLGSEREQRLIDGGLQSAERAKVLVQRLLAFARRQPLQATAVDLTTLITGMAELVSSTSGPQVQVLVDLAEALPHAYADANQVEMAILNLAVNARDAMPNGGRLTIAATSQSVCAGDHADLAPGDYVRLTVSDTGVGMDETTRARAIEPFFSTKGVGKGTGLGLSMVHGLASQLGGALRIASKPGLGTTIALWLPVASPATEQPTSDGATMSNAHVVGTALLVDDEDLVRMSTADMLADLGFVVVEANSGAAALRMIDDGLHVDILVTDHLMPGMSGADLVAAVRERRPVFPALLVSGFAEVEGIAPNLPRLTKPFKQADLAASVTALVRGRAVAGKRRRAPT